MLAGINLICTLLAYSFIAYAIASLQWRRRGIFLVLVAIIVSGEVWLATQLVSTFLLKQNAVLYWIWFANWLVSSFTVVLLWRRIKDIPPDRAEAAKMDGCGPIGIYWHIVLPLVRPALFLSAIFTLMASLAAFLILSPAILPSLGTSPLTMTNYWILAAGSALAILPAIAISFVARSC